MKNHSPKQFILNQELFTETVADGTVLLDYLRTTKRLTGTKEGCREGDCGACAVLVGELKNGAVDYRVVNSCLQPMGNLCGKHIVTIEGLTADNNPIHQAFIDENASQCGFCTPGIIIALTGYFLSAKEINAIDAIHALDGNICRCTGYVSIKRAVSHVCEELSQTTKPNRIDSLIESGIIPAWFKGIPIQLQSIQNEQFQAESKSVLVAGGTDLFVQQPVKLEESEIAFLPKSKQPVWEQDGDCFIDAAATVSDLKETEILQNIFLRLDEFIALISSTPIRNKATVGGNIVNASPIGDLSILLLALDASLGLSNGDKNRQINLKDFFLDYKNIDLVPGETIKQISFKIPEQPVLFNFEKVSKRQHLDIASVNSAMLLQHSDGFIDEIHISAGGVAPIPHYLTKTAAFLKGKQIKMENIEKAIQIAQAEISPISDVRGSTEYKRILLNRLLLAHFVTLFPDLADEVKL